LLRIAIEEDPNKVIIINLGVKLNFMKASLSFLFPLFLVIATSCNSPKNGAENTITDSTQAHAANADTAAAPTANAQATIENTYWKLIELNGQPVAMAENQNREQHMILQPSDSTVKGHGGCNGFGGNYELKPGDRIKFSKLISTMMACDNTETENQYFKVLETADNYNLVNDTLVLNKARMAPLARFKATYLK
jgi:heat shock protein HslJ